MMIQHVAVLVYSCWCSVVAIFNFIFICGNNMQSSIVDGIVHLLSELQIRRGKRENSVIIFLISQ